MLNTNSLKSKLEEISRQKQEYFNAYLSYVGAENMLLQLIKESEENDKNDNDRLSEQSNE